MHQFECILSHLISCAYYHCVGYYICWNQISSYLLLSHQVIYVACTIHYRQGSSSCHGIKPAWLRVIHRSNDYGRPNYEYWNVTSEFLNGALS